MRASRLTIEQSIHLLAFLLGLGLRALNLGLDPLADYEAAGALQALEIFGGAAAGAGTQPGYVMGTGLLFFLFGGGSALARLLPALAGAALGLVPYLLRASLGRKAALLLALGIALDPGLVALSRQATGSMLAVGLGVLALACWIRGWGIRAGILAGLTLLSGPAALSGALVLLGGMGLSRLLGLSGDATGQEAPQEAAGSPRSWRSGVLAAGGTLLLAGTLFLQVPEGIGALANTIPAYLQGWIEPSGVPAVRVLAALALYHPLPLIFGLVGAVRAWAGGESPYGRNLSLLALTALILALLYPARQVTDLAWVLLPLWALAAGEFARAFNWRGGEAGLTSLGQAALILVFLAYVWLNLAGLARFPDDGRAQLLRWQLIGGALFLIGLSTLLIIRGWSLQVGRHGLIWGLSAGLGVYTLAATWGVAGLGGDRAQEWWYPSPVPISQEYLVETIQNVSEWHTGRRDGAEILVTLEAPSLRWLLRDFPKARFSDPVSGEELPALVVTGGQNEPRLAASYRGTDFAWQRAPAWPGAFPPELLSWLVFRDAPTQTQQVILWARDDIFLDNQSEAAGEAGERLVSPSE